MIWLVAVLAIYLLIGYVILVWSEPPPEEPRDDLSFKAFVKMVVGWLPLLLVVLFRARR